MRIDSSSMSMTSYHSKTEKLTKEETLRVWVGSSSGSPDSGMDSLSLSVETKRALASGIGASATDYTEKPAVIEISPEDDMKMKLLEVLLEGLTGKKIRFRGLKLPVANTPSQIPPTVGENTGAQEPQRAGWGVAYDYNEVYREQEKLSFSAEGIVTTKDGQEISFSVQLHVSREFVSSQNISIRAGDAALIDPLVINLDGTAADLTDTQFSFDLDSDGREENLYFVKPGSGFLALDLNRNGIIDNGTELFGPQTGDGFAELAAYDEDGNGWVDESDSIYDKLRIWTKDSDGNSRLFALGQKGIGAIYVGNVDSLFEIKNPENQLKGQISKTGVYLSENGSAGTIQQLDYRYERNRLNGSKFFIQHAKVVILA